METPLVKAEQNVELSRKALVLPSYDQLEDKKIIRELQGVFKGFDFSYDDHYDQKFEDIEALEEYAQESIKEIDSFDVESKKSIIRNSGAIAAKRWVFGYVINQCLSNTAYGSKAAEKLAQAANISLAYLYQYRTVGSNLSLKDAYILGMYDAGWDTIRQLSTVKDAADRTALIKFFVEANNDWNNRQHREIAKQALKTALERYKAGENGSTPTIDCSDPAQIQTAVEFDNQAPEFADANKALLKFKKQLSVLTKEANVQNLVTTLSDCFLMDDIPGAAARLDEFKGVAADTISLLQKLENLIPTIREQLQSIDGMQLYTKEEE